MPNKSALTSHVMRLCICLLSFGGTASAQDSTARHGKPMSHVTLAISSDRNDLAPLIKRARDRALKDVIVLPTRGLTPELIASAVGTLVASMRVQGNQLPANASLRRRGGPTNRQLLLSEGGRRHYVALIQKLRSAPYRQIPGIGTLRATDILVASEPVKSR